MPQNYKTVELPIDLMRDGLRQGVQHFRSEAGQEVVQRCVEMVAHGDTRAYLAPAVLLTIDTVLNTLERPEVKEQLAPEISSRRVVALEIARFTVGQNTTLGIYPAMYAGTALERANIPEKSRELLNNPVYMFSLADTPFFDVQRVGGGALRLLDSAGVQGTQRAEIIRSSTGLLAVSGVAKENQKIANAYLGVPYIDVRHLSAQTNDADAAIQKVSFTDKAHAQLRTWSLDGRGCVAGRIETSGGILLQQYWERMVSLLVPDDATATLEIPQALTA